MHSSDSYADRLADQTFVTRADGTRVYLPWGWGRGYVVTSEEQYQRVRRFARAMIKVGTPAPWLGVVAGAVLPWRMTLAVLALSFGLYSLVFFSGLRRAVRDLPRPSERFPRPRWSFGQRVRFAASYAPLGVTGVRISRALFAVCAPLFLVGALVIPEVRRQGVGMAVLFAAGAFWSHYQLAIQREEGAARRSEVARLPD